MLNYAKPLTVHPKLCYPERFRTTLKQVFSKKAPTTIAGSNSGTTCAGKSKRLLTFNNTWKRLESSFPDSWLNFNECRTKNEWFIMTAWKYPWLWASSIKIWISRVIRETKVVLEETSYSTLVNLSRTWPNQIPTAEIR